MAAINKEPSDEAVFAALLPYFDTCAGNAPTLWADLKHAGKHYPTVPAKWWAADSLYATQLHEFYHDWRIGDVCKAVALTLTVVRFHHELDFFFEENWNTYKFGD